MVDTSCLGRIRNHQLLRAGRRFRSSCLFDKRVRYKKKHTDDTPDHIGLMGKMAHVIRGLSIPRSGTYTITASSILQLANTLSMRMAGDRAGFGSRWVGLRSIRCRNIAIAVRRDK